MSHQICAVGKAIRPLFADWVTFTEQRCIHYTGLFSLPTIYPIPKVKDCSIREFQNDLLIGKLH